MKNPDGAAFVHSVMLGIGATNPTELAERLGPPWTDRDQVRKLYKWFSGESAPNFVGTIALLRVAGMLKEDAARVPVLVPADPVVGRLAALEAKVDAQGDATTKALRGLTRAIERLPAQQAPATRPTTRKRASR